MDVNSRSKKQQRRIGKYVLLERLGFGGMSRVFSAIADDTQGKVALKITPVDNNSDVEFIDFQREVAIGRRLQHPHVVSAIECGCCDGRLFLAMPIVEGATLSNMTRLRDPLRKPASQRSRVFDDEWALPWVEGNWPHLARIAAQLSSALAACHAAGVIHRDIKPSNILMDRDGDVFLADFGLAVMHGQPSRFEVTNKDGTARYLPPEVFSKQRDGRSDIYSLGLTLHELATGRKPWGNIHHEVIRATRTEFRVPSVRSIRPEVPIELAACIDQAAADKPGRRFQTADAMQQAFLAAASRMPSDRLVAPIKIASKSIAR
ncbi:serine/threonine protein kinase [Fuerstiella marisgermanici]|uniref:Serine/threonine-protein kinase PknH n=1 Tax=Fuerstiella marisgermanici TaxID=1891926 RepID=A0A1P8WIR8_9PLAN|nr:serine/threonine-protein kinase [Fuerstiella marisgermanici]APZ93946.1 Serine/threonine-protein kinase PknH [Fuerstiella marisgermanici]